MQVFEGLPGFCSHPTFSPIAFSVPEDYDWIMINLVFDKYLFTLTLVNVKFYSGNIHCCT